jgi:hypothetical protein
MPSEGGEGTRAFLDHAVIPPLQHRLFAPEPQYQNIGVMQGSTADIYRGVRVSQGPAIDFVLGE